MPTISKPKLKKSPPYEPRTEAERRQAFVNAGRIAGRFQGRLLLVDEMLRLLEEPSEKKG